MDEVYFCMVLHKEEDRSHFLFRAVQTADNQCSPLCSKLEVSLKNAFHTLHTLSSLLTFQDVSAL